MHRAKDFAATSLWALSIVAVILLAPSSGLLTLAVPDEPYGATTTGLPDNPHIGKRTFDELDHLLIDAAVSQGVRHILLSYQSRDYLSPSNSYAEPIAITQIRAPPDTSRT